MCTCLYLRISPEQLEFLVPGLPTQVLAARAHKSTPGPSFGFPGGRWVLKVLLFLTVVYILGAHDDM